MRAAFLPLMDPKDLSCQMLVAAEVKDNIWRGRLVGQQLRITPPAWSTGTGAAFIPQNSLVWDRRGHSSVLPAALDLGFDFLGGNQLLRA